MKFVLLLHVMAGALWFGGHVYVEGVTAAAARTKDQATMMAVGLRVAQTNGRLFPVAGILVLITGFWTVLRSVYEFESLFITFGLALTLVGLALGFFILKPREDEVLALADEKGPTDPDVIEKMKGVTNLNHVMSLIVSIAIILMVLKPGL